MSLDAKTKRRITAEWTGLFPEFDPWRPLRLLRRIGPVLQGVTLDPSTSGDEYFPTSHVHALTSDFPVVSLTLEHRLLGASGIQARVPAWASKSEIEEAASELRQQSPLSLGVCPSLEEIVGRYHAVVSNAQRGGQPNGVPEIEDALLVPAVLRRQDLIESGLRLARSVAVRWSAAPMGWTDTEGWLGDLLGRAGNVEALSNTVADQVLKHKLQKVRPLPIEWKVDRG